MPRADFSGVLVASSLKSLFLSMLFILDQGESDILEGADCALADNPVQVYTLPSGIQEACWVYGITLSKILPSRLYIETTPKCASSPLLPNLKTWLVSGSRMAVLRVCSSVLDFAGPSGSTEVLPIRKLNFFLIFQVKLHVIISWI